jgi:hypothetical protein
MMTAQKKDGGTAAMMHELRKGRLRAYAIYAKHAPYQPPGFRVIFASRLIQFQSQTPPRPKA